MGHRTGVVLVAALACASVASQRAEHPSVEPTELLFGIYASDKPSEMYRLISPALTALETRAGEQLGRPIRIKLRIFATYDEANKALVDGEVDFVRFGPASYVIAKQRNPKITLLAMEKVEGKKRFEGMIVVRQDSGITELGQLRGKSFAFGDENSTIGRYLAQEELAAAGVLAKHLRKHAYLGRHDKVFRAVQFGDFAAGSVKSSTFEKLNEKTEVLRVLHRFDNVTKPWIARAGLPRELRSALRAGLLQLRDEAALAALKVSGFAIATDKDYELVRRGMRGARRFAGEPEPKPEIDGRPAPPRPDK